MILIHFGCKSQSRGSCGAQIIGLWDFSPGSTYAIGRFLFVRGNGPASRLLEAGLTPARCLRKPHRNPLSWCRSHLFRSKCHHPLQQECPDTLDQTGRCCNPGFSCGSPKCHSRSSWPYSDDALRLRHSSIAHPLRTKANRQPHLAAQRAIFWHAINMV